MNPAIILLHGRAPKPPKEALSALWFEALRRGLRSQEADSLDRFEGCHHGMIYYGDLSNQFLKVQAPDVQERWQILDSLEEADFTCYQGELDYDIETPPDDLLAYWDSENPFGQSLRQRMVKGIEREIREPGKTLFVAHSLGALLVYDALCKLPNLSRGLSLVTLGSPLSRDPLQERAERGSLDLRVWHNFSAKGDKICGPPSSHIIEHEITSPVLKDGQADPHHALGYLRHPSLAKVLAAWLRGL